MKISSLIHLNTQSSNTQIKHSKNLSNNPQLQQEIIKLQQIDAHVRAHEAAHKAAGGNLAGSATYT